MISKRRILLKTFHFATEVSFFHYLSSKLISISDISHSPNFNYFISKPSCSISTQISRSGPHAIAEGCCILASSIAIVNSEISQKGLYFATRTGVAYAKERGAFQVRRFPMRYAIVSTLCLSSLA